MNNTQVKYARERATSIYRSRKDSLKKQFTTPAVTFSNEERLAKLKSGDFEVRDHIKGHYGSYLDSFIYFPEETVEVVEAEQLKKAELELKTQYDKLMDELILGDQQEALKLLQDFDK